VTASILLIRSDENPRGRTFAQYGSTLRVESECCGAHIHSDFRVEGDIRYWMKCVYCDTILQENDPDKLWLTELDDALDIGDTEPESWAPWGKFMFGLDDFAMSVEE
jgi:hypothetical protein